MAMGHSACQVTGIKKEFLDKNFPDLMRAIENHAEFDNWDSTADDLIDTSMGDNVPGIRKLFNELQEQFTKLTETNGQGLKLFVIRYQSEDAEPYDEVEHTDGCIFAVEGVYVKTPAAQRFEQDLIEMSWTPFG